MNQDNKNEGCCPSIHAKIFEIILIIGFTLSLISLTVNLIILLWCIKYSYPLLIIEIRLIALSTISLVLSIILRVWRSDGSVFNTKFLSSFCIAIINLVLVIINLLSSIAEEVLFSFVISIFKLIYAEDVNDDLTDIMESLNYYPENRIPNMFWYTDNFNEVFKTAKKYYKTYNIFLDIMKKGYERDIFEGFNNYDEFLKKIKILKMLPWITINFNILIQLLMLIFIIILILKISSKSDLGNRPMDTQQSVKDKMLIGKSNGMDESEKRNHKEKKKKKKKKKKKVI